MPINPIKVANFVKNVSNAIKAQNKPKPAPTTKKPVVAIPPPPRPVIVQKKAPDTIWGMPKPVVYVGGTLLGIGAVVGIAKAVSK